MDLRKIIHELEIEKQRLDQAIMALERLSAGTESRRAAAHKTFDLAGEDGRIHEAHSEPLPPAILAHSIRK
jgi:hypothetical protein